MSTKTHAAQGLRVETREGAAVESALGPLAELRIAVFYEFPYLYEGTQAYEEQYLQTYVRSARSQVVLVWDGAKVVGASTVIPLLEAPSEMQGPFVDAGFDLARVDYFGESVLLPEFRGRGLGLRFFELREAHARRQGLSICAFCAVERSVQHPLCPPDYVPLDSFWAKRGYHKFPQLRAQLTWQDRGESEPSAKDMTFWIKHLDQVAHDTEQEQSGV